MEENSRVAYIISQSVAAMITAMGMQAENKQREHLGQSVAYQEDSFQKVIIEHGIRTNDVISYLRE